MTPQELYNERQQLIEDTLALKPTKRVVNAVRVSYWPFFEYGLTLADAMKDYDRVNECMIRFHKEFHPDVGSAASGCSPSRVFELAGMKTVRWPGDAKGLGVNNPYQFIEFETMMEDEYEELLAAPAQFAIEKYMPRIADIFNPLSQIDWLASYNNNMALISAFTSPAMLEMYKKFEEIAKVNADYRQHSAELKKALVEMGYPFITGTASTSAFDMLADYLRCTMGCFTDTLIQPENMKRLLDRFVEVHIRSSLNQCTLTGNKYAWVMLHKAFDGFISDETYSEFYWPYLKKWALAMIDNGLVPVLFAEGPYTQRLKYLEELPKGKCLIVFESVDFKEAKRVLGGRQCMMGGFPNQLLLFGTPAEVSDKAKEIMDIMCPDGGYMFAGSSLVDNAKRENLEALFQTIEDYGKY